MARFKRGTGGPCRGMRLDTIGEAYQWSDTYSSGSTGGRSACAPRRARPATRVVQHSNPSQEVSGAPIVAEAEPRLGESSLSKGDHLRGRERVDDS
jgi:hypothetical protein